MPVYCYTTDDGWTYDRKFPVTDIPAEVEINGKVAKRDLEAEILSQRHRVALERNRPVKHNHGMIESDALGCHPDQVPELKADAKRRGVKVEFDSEGTALFATRKQKKEYAEAYGFYDRNGGYGDAQRSKKYLNYEE